MSLQNRDIFDQLPEEAVEVLLAAGRSEEVAKGAILFDENDRIQDLYIVLEGYVSLYRSSRYGDVKIIFVCRRGEALNETIIADERTAIAAKALSNAKLLRIARSRLEAFLMEYPQLAMTLFASMSYKTRRLYHQVGNANRTYPMEKKLAAKLWKMARDYGEDSETGRKIGFDVTVTMLANMLGAKRETISREISSLKSHGLLLHENGQMTVTDMTKLRELM